MILSMKQPSPISPGLYVVRLVSVNQMPSVPTKSGIRRRYEFRIQLLTNPEVVVNFYFLWSSYEYSPYGKFVTATKRRFNLKPQEPLDTDILLDRELTAKVSTYTDHNGNECPALEWLAPVERDDSGLFDTVDQIIISGGNQDDYENN